LRRAFPITIHEVPTLPMGSALSFNISDGFGINEKDY
jgi:hypothetical protein